MNLHSVPALLTALLSLSLGGCVYLKGRKHTINRVWALLSVSIALWSFSFAFVMNAPNEKLALLGVRALYLGAIPIPVLFLHFILAYRQTAHREKVMLGIGYAVSILFLGLTFTGLLIRDITPHPVLVHFGVPGKAYVAFVVFWFAVLSLSFREMILWYRQETSAIRKNQLRYLFLASAIGFAGGSTAALPAFNVEFLSYGPYGYYLVGLYTAVITYAIVKHRLMDITVVIKKGVTYSLLLLSLLVPCYAVVMLSQVAFFNSVSTLFSLVILLLFILVAFVFPKLRLRAERTIEQALFKTKYDYKETLGELSRAMVKILDLRTLSKKIVSTVSEAMPVENVILFVLDEEKSRYNIFRSTDAGDLGISFGNLRDYPALNWLTEKGEAVIREELERDRAAPEVVEQMASFGAEVCIPLLAKGKLIGMVALGPKGGGKMYSQEDLDMLTTLANQACIAIENARLYEDLRRTRVHMHRAERLASLGTLTAGLAHEIRNPLVAIKTFTELLPERIDDEEFRNHFLKVTAGEVDRISSLVTELLEFSRPSPPNLKEEQLNEVVEKMLLLVATETKKKGLVVEKELWDKLPSVLIDREQIKQVLLNVLLNAADATPEKGSITVRTRKVARNGQRDLVQIEIRDTGNGISPDKLEHIFTPFYTTKYDGSGLGLAISHQIIQEHEGYIDVESKVDSGTTFYINLPINPSATALNGEKNEEVAGP